MANLFIVGVKFITCSINKMNPCYVPYGTILDAKLLFFVVAFFFEGLLIYFKGGKGDEGDRILKQTPL